MDELAPGAIVERYTVEHKLGEGGMAAVYRVRHTTLGTVHALKVLTVGGKKIRQRLVQEGRVQAMINHPHVVAVRDVLDVDGSPGLLMDFVDGPDLEAWITTHKPGPELAREVFRQVVVAVQAAHERGLIHRDLKPANVLMRRLPSGEWQAKVADFGLAKALEDGKEGLGLTRQGAAMGTPAFMAPEQIKDASSVDHRADIWALGCIYYQLLTGEQAFDGLDIVEVFNAVSTGEFVPPSQIRPELPEEVDDTITGCLQIDVTKRLGSCGAVLAALDGLDGPTRAATTWEGAAITPRRPTKEVLSDVPAATGGPADIPGPPGAQPSSTPPAGGRPGATPFGWAIPIVMAVLVGGGSLVAVGAIAMLAASMGYGDTCSGWVKGPLIFTKTEGTDWLMPAPKEVVIRLPSEDNDWTPGTVACTLPSGSTVTLVEEPVRLGRAGIWIRVMPDNIALPEPETEAEASP